MECNFNNLRKNIANDWNKLINSLNENVEHEMVEVGYIEDNLNSLQGGIGTLLSLYDEEQGIDWIDIKLEQFGGDE